MKKENFVTLIMSVIGGLIFALGMCMALLPEWNAFQPGVICGIIIGISGIAILAMAYPIFNKVTQKRKEMLAPEILRLSEEISKDNFSEK